MIIFNDPRCADYAAANHPERPARVIDTVARLRSLPELGLEWQAPLAVREEHLAHAHSAAHLHHLLSTTEDFDPDTPWFHEIAHHAWRSVGGALGAMEAALRGELAFSCLRPPGHHATRGHAMGFCYLNNVAVAVLEAIKRGVPRVAVFDFDVHHGNGTEAILLGHRRAATFSVHQYPCYPGTGTEHLGENAFNYPVAPMTGPQDYRAVLSKALEDLRRFRPELVAVSAGFDAYLKDPIAQEMLGVEDFYWLGEQVRELGVPAFTVLEGGYSDDLPLLVEAYLRGWMDR